MSTLYSKVIAISFALVSLGFALGCGEDSNEPSTGAKAPSEAVDFTGSFSGDEAILTLSLQEDQRLAGHLQAAGQRFEVIGSVQGNRFTGRFTHDGTSFPLEGTMANDQFTLNSEGATYVLSKKRSSTNPLSNQSDSARGSSSSHSASMDQIRAMSNRIGDSKDSSQSSSRTAPQTLTGTYHHPTGFQFDHPGTWKTQEIEDVVAIVPPDARTTYGQPAEAYIVFGVPAEGVRNIRAPEVTQGAHEILKSLAPFATLTGSPSYQQLGSHSVAIFDASGRAPSNLNTKVRIWATIIGDFAFGLCAMAPSDAFDSRTKTVEPVVASFRMGKPKTKLDLVGTWKNSETYISGEFSTISVTYLVLRPDGTCTRGADLHMSSTHRNAEGIQTGSSTGSSTGGDGAQGRWIHRGDTLYLQFAGDEEYGVYVEGQPGGRTLMLKTPGKNKIWYEQ